MKTKGSQKKHNNTECFLLASFVLAYPNFTFRCSMRNLLSDNLLWYIGTSGKRTLKK